MPFLPLRQRRSAAARGQCSGGELLALADYYDQPHLIRTFRRFSGFTPSEYLRLIRQHGPEYATFVPLETPTAVR